MAGSLLKEPKAVFAITPEIKTGYLELRGVSLFALDKNKLFRAKVVESADYECFIDLFLGGVDSPILGKSNPNDVALSAWFKWKIRKVNAKATITVPAFGETLEWDSGPMSPDDEDNDKQMCIWVNFCERGRLRRAAKDDVLTIKLDVKAWKKDPEKVDTITERQPMACLGARTKGLETLLRKGIGTDVALRASTGEVFRAHRVVLASASQVFERMLLAPGMAEAATDGEVQATDIEPNVLRWFLDVIYSDNLPPEVMGDGEALCHLLAAANKYQVQPLVELCEAGVASLLTDDTACERLMMADLFGLEGLRQLVLRYMVSTVERLAAIQATEAYERLSEQRPRLLRDILALTVTPKKKKRSIPAAGGLPENLDALPVAELKKLLADRGLPGSGNKAALLSRLREADADPSG